jgi:hypothetical protein
MTGMGQEDHSPPSALARYLLFMRLLPAVRQGVRRAGERTLADHALDFLVNVVPNHERASIRSG